MNRLLNVLSALLLTVAYVGCGGGGAGGSSGTEEGAAVDTGALAGVSVNDPGVDAQDESPGGDEAAGDEESAGDGGADAGDGGVVDDGSTLPPAPSLTNSEVVFDVLHYSFDSADPASEYSDVLDALDALEGWTDDGAVGALTMITLLRGELPDDVLAEIEHAIVDEGHATDPMTADMANYVAQIVRAQRRHDRTAARIATLRDLVAATQTQIGMTLTARLDEAEQSLADLDAAIRGAIEPGLHEAFLGGSLDTSDLFLSSESAPSADNIADMATFETEIVDAVGGLMERAQTGDADAIELGTAFYAAYARLGPLSDASSLNQQAIAAVAEAAADEPLLIVVDGVPMPVSGEGYQIRVAAHGRPNDVEEVDWSVEGDVEMLVPHEADFEGWPLEVPAGSEAAGPRRLRVRYEYHAGGDEQHHASIELRVVPMPPEIARRSVTANVFDELGNPIPGARVELLEQEDGRIARGEHGYLLHTQSDALGTARVVWVGEGPLFARISADGFEPVIVPILMPSEDGDFLLDPVHLAPALD